MTPELTAIIAATVALAGLILNGNRALNQRMDRLETRLDRLETRMDRLEAGVGQMEARLSQVEARLNQVEVRLNQVEARFTGVEREQAHLAGWPERLREAIGGSRVA